MCKSGQIVNIKYVDECFNDNIRVNFVNRYGAIQSLWFFGRLKDSLNVEKTMFKRNLRADGTFSTARHQNTILDKNGTTKIELSTGWYPEDHNPTFQELMLSEQVWITMSNAFNSGNKFALNEETYPVLIENSQIQFLKKDYDKLINYDFTFAIANNKIQTVR